MWGEGVVGTEWRRGPPVGVCGWSLWRGLLGKSLDKWMKVTSGGNLPQDLAFIWGPGLSPLGFRGLPFPLNRQPVESWWKIRERG